MSARYLVGGTTSGIAAMLLAAARAAPTRRSLILPRHCHRSVVSAAVLAQLDPVFCRPATTADGLACGLDLAHLAELLAATPSGVAAVLDVYPTAHGRAGDLAGAASLAHAAGTPLLVDGAHAGLFGLEPRLPQAPLAAGADAVVISAHKTLGSLGQTSLLLLGGGPLAPDAAGVAAAIRLVQTTSPSYPFLLSLEAAVNYYAETRHGRRRLSLAVDHALWAADQIAAAGCGLLRATGGGLAQDPMRLVIDAWSIGSTGTELAAWLRQDSLVQVEAADWRTVLLALGPGQRRDGLRRVAAGVREAPQAAAGQVADAGHLDAIARAVWETPARRALSPSRAWFGPRETVALDRAARRVAAEALSPYPPGIPVVWPGEEITPGMVEMLRGVLASGGGVHGLAGPGRAGTAGDGASAEPRALVVAEGG
jgi:arginine/lysine/ornithine decarboxylase